MWWQSSENAAGKHQRKQGRSYHRSVTSPAVLELGQALRGVWRAAVTAGKSSPRQNDMTPPPPPPPVVPQYVVVQSAGLLAGMSGKLNHSLLSHHVSVTVSGFLINTPNTHTLR